MLARRLSSLRFRRFVLPIILVWLASAAWRLSHVDDELVVSNIGASYHVLLTVRAFDETPASVHHFLPIVSLGRPLDRDVPFGASIRGPGGIYYYTSFPSLGFVAPWAFFKITTLAPTLTHLMVFNLTLHLAATLLLAFLVFQIVGESELSASMRGLLVALAALTYLFDFETQWSQGLVYWHHSLFQVVWLVQLIAATSVFRALERGERPRRSDGALLLATAFLGPAIEWTGYLASAIVAVVIWWRVRRVRVAAASVATPLSTSHRAATRLALGMIVATAAAGIAFIVQFATVIGFGPLFTALAERAATRSAAHGSFAALWSGYIQSFGVLLALGAVVIGAYVVVVREHPPGWLSAVLIVVTFPLIENVILTEHATTYHFDRLKVLVTCVVVVASLIMRCPPMLRDRLTFAWAVVVMSMFTRTPASRAGAVLPPLSSNHRLLRAVHSLARPCTIYATNGAPRGWAELSVGGNIYESVPDVDSLERIVDARGACQGIFLRVALDAGESMYVWRNASVYDAASRRLAVLPGTEPRRPRIPLAQRVEPSDVSVP